VQLGRSRARHQILVVRKVRTTAAREALSRACTACHRQARSATESPTCSWPSARRPPARRRQISDAVATGASQSTLFQRPEMGPRAEGLADIGRPRHVKGCLQETRLQCVGDAMRVRGRMPSRDEGYNPLVTCGGPGRYCSSTSRHRMTFNSRSEGSTCVSMTWRAVSQYRAGHTRATAEQVPARFPVYQGLTTVHFSA